MLINVVLCRLLSLLIGGSHFYIVAELWPIFQSEVSFMSRWTQNTPSWLHLILRRQLARQLRLLVEVC